MLKSKKLLMLWLAFVILNVGCQSSRMRQMPLIGITSVHKVDSEKKAAPSVSVCFSYVRAVLESGGAPVILPTIDSEEVMRRYVDELDGLVLIGGADIPPSVYGQEPHETVRVMTRQRYDFESELIPLWLATGKPVLGVCLGMQFANVASGGSMIQDIPSQVGKKVNHRCKAELHLVRIEPGSKLRKILGSDEAMVFSSHHQAVREIGRNLRVVAHSPDGVVEALERVDGGFGLFVQWHPEVMKNAVHRKAIYGALIRACLKRN